MKPKLFALAANAAADMTTADDGWFQVAPYGTSRFSPDGKQWYDQIFGREDADAMVEAFNSVTGKVARTIGGGLPIFEGHPDVDPARYPVARRLGKITELEARDDGLWAKPAWNALGRENVEQGYWVYPSPVWYYPRPKPGVRSFHPDELKSVGLTNSPNIRETQPVGANSEPGETDTETTEGESTDNIMKLKPETMQALGLTEEGREYTPEEIETAILAAATAKADAENAMAASAEAKAAAEEAKTKAEEEMTTAQNALTTAREERDQARAAAANAILDAGITAGIVTKADADKLRENPDVEVAANAIKTAATARALPAGQIDIGGRRVAINSEREVRATVLEAVNARMEAHNETYDQAWAACKRDRNYAPLFEAMAKRNDATEA